MDKITKFLFFPLKGSYTTQLFGQDKTCTDTETGKVFIGKKTEDTCPTGYISLYKKMGLNGHNGVDLFAKMWQPVYASCDGFVEEVQTKESVGLGIGIITEKKYYCGETGKEEYFKYRNWHFQALNVVKNQKIKTGDMIGWAGMTGYATGPHDHFELKPVAQNKKGEWYNILQSNGYFGAIDPLPYLSTVCAVDANGIKKITEGIAQLLDALSTMLRGTPVMK